VGYYKNNKNVEEDCWSNDLIQLFDWWF